MARGNPSVGNAVSDWIITISVAGETTIYEAMNRIDSAGEKALGRLDALANSFKLLSGAARGLGSAFTSAAAFSTGIGKAINGALYVPVQTLRNMRSLVRQFGYDFNRLGTIGRTLAGATFLGSGGLVAIASKDSKELTKLGESIANLAQVVGDTFAPQMRAATKALNSLANAYKGLDDATKKNLQLWMEYITIGGLATAVTAKIVRGIGGLLGMFVFAGEAIVGPMMLIVDVITSVMSSVFSLAGSIVSTLLPAIVGIAGSITGYALKAIASLSISLLKLGTEVIAKVAASISVLFINFAVLLAQSGMAFASFATIASVAAIGLTVAIGVLIAKAAILGAIFAAGIGGVALTAWAMQATEALKGVAVEGMAGISDMVDVLVAKFKFLRDNWREILADWKNIIKNAFKGGADIWNSMVQGAENAINAIVVAFIGGFYKIQSGLESLSLAFQKMAAGALSNPILTRALGIDEKSIPGAESLGPKAKAHFDEMMWETFKSKEGGKTKAGFVRGGWFQDWRADVAQAGQRQADLAKGPQGPLFQEYEAWRRSAVGKTAAAVFLKSAFGIDSQERQAKIEAERKAALAGAPTANLQGMKLNSDAAAGIGKGIADGLDNVIRFFGEGGLKQVMNNPVVNSLVEFARSLTMDDEGGGFHKNKAGAKPQWDQLGEAFRRNMLTDPTEMKKVRAAENIDKNTKETNKKLDDILGDVRGFLQRFRPALRP